MKKIIYGLVLAVVPLINAAADEVKAYLTGDTLFYNQDYQIMPAKKIKKAVYYGVVKSINDDNIATIAVYDKKDQTLHALLKRIASGNEFGAKKGEQCYYYPNGTIKETDVYALFYDDKNSKATSYPVSEKLMYPDGKIQEEVLLSYAEKKQESYKRTGYFPDGSVQFLEIRGEKDTYSLTFYDEAGNITEETPKNFTPYMTMPEYPGGQGELLYFLSRSVQYPEECQKKGIQGRVICQFTVAKNGKIEDVRVVRSGGHPLLDREAIRVLRSMPKWKPGTKRGKPIRVKYTVPVNFALE
ncbi:MAG: energy transducer TonB [Paludibacteraceae bacterium]|nr:energy transducer TonB [Paludibacteraceae bacterium]